MVQDVLAQVVERASTDAAFRARLQSDLAGALAGYALGEEERAALLQGAARPLQALGVDTRISKFSESYSDSFGNNGPWS